MTRAALAVAVAALAAACSIDHPSDVLACSTPNDCASPRTCVDGYCVEGAVQCPSACASCDLVTKHCNIDRSGGGNGGVTCPADWSCTITCGANACNSVDCSDAASCQVTCSGANACNNVNCGAGACTVTCSGNNACRQVDCRDSCACDVTCADAQSCDQTSQCPDQACESGSGCTSQPAGCSSC